MAHPRPVDSGFTVEEKAAADAKSARNRRPGRILGAIFWLTAGVLTLGFWTANDLPYLTSAGVRYQSAVGTIERTDSGDRGRCTIDLSFTVEGQSHDLSERVQRAYCEDTVGKRMWVRYDPENIPETATVRTAEQSQFGAWARLFVGLTLAGIGLLLLRSSARLKVPGAAKGSGTRNPTAP